MNDPTLMTRFQDALRETQASDSASAQPSFFQPPLQPTRGPAPQGLFGSPPTPTPFGPLSNSPGVLLAQQQQAAAARQAAEQATAVALSGQPKKKFLADKQKQGFLLAGFVVVGILLFFVAKLVSDKTKAAAMPLPGSMPSLYAMPPGGINPMQQQQMMMRQQQMAAAAAQQQMTSWAPAQYNQPGQPGAPQMPGGGAQPDAGASSRPGAVPGFVEDP